MKNLILIALIAMIVVNATDICGTTNEYTTLSLSCPSGEVFTGFTFASYGMPTGGCSAPAVNATCHSTTSTTAVSNICLGQTSCTVAASNGVFGDPCVGIVKRLTVKATCAQPAPFNYGNSCNRGDAEKVLEHQSLTVGCSEGTISSVLYASYGKPVGTTWGGFTNGACHATTSLSVVQAACVGQTSCTVAAENSVFGDPCVGTFKDLAVIVQCSCPPTYNCGNYASYNQYTTYSSGAIVFWGGFLFRSRINNNLGRNPTNDGAAWSNIYRCPCDCSGLDEWRATQVYNGGERVANTGACWKANWWTQGDVPTSNPFYPWTPWTRKGWCTGTSRDTGCCDDYLPWNAAQIYSVVGERVVRSGVLYQSKWWNQNDDPATSTSGAWKIVYTCQRPYQPDTVDCTGVAAWNVDAVYWGSAKVRRGNRVYRARWWTQGEDPVNGGVWDDRAICGGNN